MKSILCFAMIAGACAVSFSSFQTRHHDKKIPPVVIHGSDSEIIQNECHRISTAEEWKELMNRHDSRIGNTALSPSCPMLPKVDFENYEVVALFKGAENSTGIKSCNVETNEKGTVVQVQFQSFQTAVIANDNEDLDNGVTIEKPGGTYALIFLPKSSGSITVQRPVIQRMEITGWEDDIILDEN